MPAVNKPQANGTPTWVNILTHDVSELQRFYGEIVGWEFTEASAQLGGYVQAYVGTPEHPVAGIGPSMADDSSATVTVFLATDDIEACVATVADLGGTVPVHPMPVGGLGTMALCTDPVGIPFGLWQAGSFEGMALMGEPGAPAWFDLGSRDLPTTRSFLERLFGYEFTMGTADTGDFENAMVSLDGVPWFGAYPLGADDDGPGAWATYFTVPSLAQALTRAEGLGAEVVVPMTSIPEGAFAWLRGLQGEGFGLFQLA